MPITALTIRNFRSIVQFSDKVAPLNIFVGQNDEGKSNVVRALDLFFNHEKKGGYELQWNRDYSYFAPERVRKADEITVELEITPPQSFKNAKPVLWRKVWRKNGLNKNIVKYRDGTEPDPRSKIHSFLGAMRFDYVPAIKGENYFRALMSTLHDMLEITVEDEIRRASGSFTKTINDNTKSILQDIQDRLGLDTTIQLPPDLRELFGQLEFTSVSGEKPFSLQQRGDGIKVRHIPIVLRWLADQANYLSAPGRPKAVTIWGYEEPENNLEMRRCFELAQDFVEGSDTIQAFVTTHSPAFYSVCRSSTDGTVKIFMVTKDEDPPTTQISPLRDTDVATLDSAMGLLDFLEPHFSEAREELDRLRAAAESLVDTSKPTIFCEGLSDEELVKIALKLFYPDEAKLIRVCACKQKGGGHTWVGDRLLAWAHLRPAAYAVGLFDKDAAAQATRKRVGELLNDRNNAYASCMSLKPGEELKGCYRKQVRVPFAIEELLPEDVWDHAEQSGWLEKRPNPISLYGFSRTDITFEGYFEGLLSDDHLRRIALKKVKIGKKADLCKYVKELTKNERQRVLEALAETLHECVEKLRLDEGAS